MLKIKLMEKKNVFFIHIIFSGKKQSSLKLINVKLPISSNLTIGNMSIAVCFSLALL